MFEKIKAVMVAIAVSLMPAVMSVAATSTVTHTVKKGETIYGISKSYGISIETLLQYNPSARDGLKTGQELVLPSTGQSQGEEGPLSKAELAAAKKKTYHTVVKGETLYSIAKSYGMTLDELLALNPGIDSTKYAPGTVLRLTNRTALPAGQSTVNTQSLDITTPAVDDGKAADKKSKKAKDKKKKSKKDKQAAEAEAVEPVAENESQTDEGISEDVQPERPLSVAMILPFMLNETELSTQAKLYTEFYKGFMLAADTLSHRGAPVKIYAFDSAGSLDTVSMIMSKPEIKNMSVIIAPDEQDQLALIANAAAENGTYVYNLFSIKDTIHETNPWVIQANVPHDEMYDMAIDNFIKRFDGFTPVFISHLTGKNEKSEFTQALKEALTEKGVGYKEIGYPNYLSSSDLKDLSAEERYVFVPVSGSRVDFNKFASALRTFKAERADQDGVRVFGYPEWVTFRGDAYDTLCELNSTIYSRFYNDANAYPSRNLNASFRRWFGREMIDAVPLQGALGFDTGYFLIKAMRDNEGDFSRRISPFEGVQSAFDFAPVESENGGLVNDALYFVYFRPGGFVEKVKL